MNMKKIGFKNLVIILLGVALIISFFFGQKSDIDTHKDEISNLHSENDKIMLLNDSLMAINNELDAEIKDINKSLVINANKLSATQLELNKLKKRKNETTIYVNNLSSNGVSNAFTDYLNSKGTNNRQY